MLRHFPDFSVILLLAVTSRVRRDASWVTVVSREPGDAPGGPGIKQPTAWQ